LLAACSTQGSVADSTSVARPSTAPTLPATKSELPPQPRIEKETVTKIQPIAFPKKTVKDPSLEKGQRVVTTRGVTGKKRLTYEATLIDGVQTGKRLVGSVVVTKPIAQVTAIGTKPEPQPEPEPASGCYPNYSGACVPISSDVDCAGGSGNGPAYVDGPVTVVGADIYDLDRDGDGTGCDS
jgi:hypothetical protein